VHASIASSSPYRFHPRALARVLSIFFTTAAFAGAMTGAAPAQTLTNPNPAPHAPAASSQRSKAQKSCPMYGPGFVQVPGSDLCIKVGGFVQGEVTVGH
jgi:hypothetical protein